VINRRAGLLIAQTLLGLALLVAWLYLVDLGEVGRTLSQARWHLVLLAAVIGLSSGVLRAQRWRIVLRPIAHVPLIDLWLINMASSLVNFIIPLRTGEIARSLLLKQRHRVSIAASLPTIAVDRSFDLVAILILGTVGALSGITVGGRLAAVLLAAGVLFLAFVLFVILAILSGERLLAFFVRLLPSRLSSHVRERILGLLEKFLAGFTAVGRRPKALAPMLAISILSAVLDGTLYYFLFASLGSIQPPAIVLTGYSLFTLTFLVPGGPGYIGSMEAFGSLVFSALGVGRELAASTVVLFHALNAVMLGIIGGLAMWTLGLRPSTAVRSFIEAGETSITSDPSEVEV
jgi:hypothetical protein